MSLLIWKLQCEFNAKHYYDNIKKYFHKPNKFSPITNVFNLSTKANNCAPLLVQKIEVCNGWTLTFVLNVKHGTFDTFLMIKHSGLYFLPLYKLGFNSSIYM